jgi:hypothetical protein
VFESATATIIASWNAGLSPTSEVEEFTDLDENRMTAPTSPDVKAVSVSETVEPDTATVRCDSPTARSGRGRRE